MVAMEYFLRTLLPAECQAIGMQPPNNPREMIAALE